eukprot:4244348-Pleurochrysis_carterae.AAC.1
MAWAKRGSPRPSGRMTYCQGITHRWLLKQPQAKTKNSQASCARERLQRTRFLESTPGQAALIGRTIVQ